MSKFTKGDKIWHFGYGQRPATVSVVGTYTNHNRKTNETLYLTECGHIIYESQAYTKEEYEALLYQFTETKTDGEPQMSKLPKIELNALAQSIFKSNQAAGWWTDNPEERNKPELLCLIHSEISEAMEGLRKDLNDDHLPERKMVEVELADAVIRILDMAGAFGYDIEGALYDKFAYNQQRADHKKENREKEGGKKF